MLWMQHLANTMVLKNSLNALKVTEESKNQKKLFCAPRTTPSEHFENCGIFLVFWTPSCDLGKVVIADYKDI